MQLSTSLLPTKRHCHETIDVAVVIDVLRATSVMAMAIQSGVKRILTCREVETAFTLADQQSTRPLLCGERGCKPIDGFDLGNSPAEYTSAVVAGRELVLTTTNGTRAIEVARGIPQVITASFLNLTAVVNQLRTAKRAHLICAGTEGEVTAEDVLLAGAIVRCCQQLYGATWEDDPTTLAHGLWLSKFPTGKAAPSQLSDCLRETRGGRNLVRVGYELDLDRCAAIDTLSAVPTRVSSSPAAFAG